MNSNYQELSNRAYSLHQTGRYKEAEELYNMLLDINPDDTNVLNLYGLLCLVKDNINKAIDLLSKAVVLNKSTYILTNLAKAYYMAEDYKKAIILYLNVAKEEPNDDVFYSLALAYKKNNNIEEAINSYKKALAFNKKNTSVLYNLSIMYKDKKDIQNALKYALRAELINENDEDTQTLLSTIYESSNKLKKAIQHLEKAFKINNNNTYLYNMAIWHSKLNQKENAINLYNQILENDPTNFESCINLSYLYKNIDESKCLFYANMAYKIKPTEKIVCLAYAQILKDTLHNNESIKVLNEFLKTNKNADGYSLLAINYMDLLDYKTALQYYSKALELAPNNQNYLHGKAMALKYLGKTDEARLLMEYIVQNNKSSLQSRTTLGMMYLQEKHFEKGMDLYIERSKETKFEKLFPTKKWEKGIDLKNKTVLVYSDCGLGDTIMFARYLTDLSKIATKVILQTDRELIQILSNNFKNIEIVRKSAKVENYDLVISIMTLPYALNINFDNIPRSNKYIEVDETEVEKLKQSKVFNNKNLKVGLFYQGNKNVFKNRSLDIELVNKLLELDNLKYYSFQLENNPNLDERIIKLNTKIKNYNDTAKLLKCIDVLVTIDSSIAHMAGALGVKTYLLLPYTAEWRWFNDTKTTPWYKSIRIIKQTSPNDWESVINKLEEELKNESRK